MSFTFTKKWDVVKNYTVGDIVIHNGNQYVARIQNTGESPPSSSWRKISRWLDNAQSFVAESDLVSGVPVATTGLGKIEQAVDNKPAIGVLVEDTDTGEKGDVVVTGYINNINWVWVPETPIWIDNGELTQTTPTDVLQQIGVAISPTAMLVNPQDIITLV